MSNRPSFVAWLALILASASLVKILVFPPLSHDATVWLGDQYEKTTLAGQIKTVKEENDRLKKALEAKAPIVTPTPSPVVK